jgi:hypothetical protein
MSRFITTGRNPKNGELVNIAYGWDCVPGFPEGYFFQVYSKDPEICKNDREGIILNEGFIIGLKLDRLQELANEWGCKLKGL